MWQNLTDRAWTLTVALRSGRSLTYALPAGGSGRAELPPADRFKVPGADDADPDRASAHLY